MTPSHNDQTLVLKMAAVVLLIVGLVTACRFAPDRPASSQTSGGDRVVVLATGTSKELRPSLTARALWYLRTAANSKNVNDGPSGKGSVAVLTSADGEVFQSLPLTPRRADGMIEYGLQRQTLIEENLHRVAAAVAMVTEHRPGIDILEGMINAVRGSGAGVLIVVSSGLSTSGGFDLRQVGWTADPDEVAAQLRLRDLLPNLTRWRVLFTGMGATYGNQPPLPNPIRDKLSAYWSAICKASRAASCEFDDSRIEADPPKATVDTPIVAIPGIVSVAASDGKFTASISDDLLGFAGDSAALSPAAEDLLRKFATNIISKLADNPGAVVTINGWTADPPGSTAKSREQLGKSRARVVAKFLTADGVINKIEITGGGTAPGLTAFTGGVFDETIATQMRRVEITY